jgi:two-component system, cell cycle sensor histidine kinase and response regulator CckA
VEGPPVDLATDGARTYTASDGGHRLGALKGLTGPPWVVWVELRRDLAVARATTFLQRMSALGLVIAVGTVLLVRWFTIGVTAPLSEMTTAAESMAAGDYSQRVRTDRADEIGRLGRAFNTMANEVAIAHSELEQRVQKRTHDLNAALAALNRQSRERETYLATIVDSSADAIIAQDLNGIVTTWNKSAERIFGYAVADIVGTSILQLAPPDRQREETQILESIRNGESVENLQTVRLTRGGRRIDVSITASPIRDATGRIIGASELTRDVTERRTLEAQYLQAQKMEAVGRLAGGVAHDFNNLLTAILGYCELLLGSMPSNDPLRTDIIEIQKAGTSAAALTRQLLTFSRKQVVEPTLLDLNVVVSEMRGMLTRLIREDVTVTLRVSPEPAMVLADRGQLEQILLNLAVNARDAMPSGGTLTIETAHVELDEHYAAAHFNVAPGHYVMLSVSDTGTGMTPEVQAHIFEPFFTTKEVGKGTGLGLATVHGIVTRSGGSVGVYSELNKGTSFKVYLPVAGVAPQTSARLELLGGRPFGPHTILVVDDADHVRELARRLLQRQGYRVLLAAHANEARQLFEKVPSIDVLLTDVVMPGASGPDLTRQLIDEHPGLKVIYMSGYTEEAVMTHGVLNPGIAFLHKPFTSDALARKIREVLSA